MAVYTPVALVPMTSLSATPGTSVYTQPAATVSILRTIHSDTSGSGKTVTASIGADAAGTRLLDVYPLTTSVPLVLNGWWVIASGAGGAHAIDANCAATTVSFMVGGYEYA